MFSKYSRRARSSQQYQASNAQEPQDLSESELRVAAINLLSRREYSHHELLQKLSQRSADIERIEQVLDNLTSAGYQNDERFAESFLRSRINRGLGRMRIERELKEKGVGLDLIEQVIQQDHDWFELAYDAGLKKSQSLDLVDYKEKQKLFRYLAYRGFSMDQIQYAIERYLAN